MPIFLNELASIIVAGVVLFATLGFIGMCFLTFFMAKCSDEIISDLQSKQWSFDTRLQALEKKE